MHSEAYQWLSKQIAPIQKPLMRVLEIGSRDINGSPRSIFTVDVTYWGIDIAPGPGVDLVADAADGEAIERALAIEQFDLAICAEVFEHTPALKQIIANVAKRLTPEGVLLITAAGIGRAAHSAVDGRLLAPHECSPIPVRDGREYYRNVTNAALEDALKEAGFGSWRIEHDRGHGDLYAVATRDGVLA